MNFNGGEHVLHTFPAHKFDGWRHWLCRECGVKRRAVTQIKLGGPPDPGYAPPGPCGKVENEMRRAIPPGALASTPDAGATSPHKEAFTPKPPIPRRIGGFLLANSQGLLLLLTVSERGSHHSPERPKSDHKVSFEDNFVVKRLRAFVKDCLAYSGPIFRDS
jgi:hypothetical protein